MKNQCRSLSGCLRRQLFATRRRINPSRIAVQNFIQAKIVRATALVPTANEY